jgi:hypothetical protein
MLKYKTRPEHFAITENESAWQQSMFNDFDAAKAYIQQRELERALNDPFSPMYVPQ